MQKINNYLAILTIVAVSALVSYFSLTWKFGASSTQASKTAVETPTTPIEDPQYEFGMRVDTFKMMKQTILPNEFVSEILTRFNVDNQIIHELAQKSSDVYDFRKFKAGNDYTILASNQADTVARYMVYEKNPIEYVVYNLENPEDIQERKRPTSKKTRSITGTIQSSLWETLSGLNADPDLAVKLAMVYQWTVDFTRIQAGDTFDIAFDEIYVDGEYYRSDSIKAAFLNHGGKDLYAFYYDQGEGKQGGYYDENGTSLKRAFLKAPVKYSRISSRYTRRRFHPVQKRYKAHLGTDFAAARGTPIVATADGTVSKRGYTRGNGNYVKIRHNSTYSTQYLHMSKFKSGVNVGTRVQQGDVIGYVGSTGLATGPHVCYRFWKNNKQVDPLQLDFPAGDPIEEQFMAEFEVHKANCIALLEEAVPLEELDNSSLIQVTSSIP